MKFTFQEVAITAKKQWKENGKTRTKTRRFYQYLSPFNINMDGTLKTREQILAEITEKRDMWLAE